MYVADSVRASWFVFMPRRVGDVPFLCGNELSNHRVVSAYFDLTARPTPQSDTLRRR